MKIIQENDQIYHGNREFIGSTELRQMELSPKHFFTAWKQLEETKVTEAMEIGSMLHSLLLEQNVDKFVARPLNDKGELVRSNSKEYAAFLAANPGKTPIRPDLHSSLYDALTAFADNKTAMRLIDKANIEQSIYATDHESGMQVKARPDIWGPGYLVDLKSTSVIDKNFEKTIFANRYDFQLAHYAETIRSATGETIKDFYILAFERQAPFGSKIFKIPRFYIDEQAEIRKIYLNEIALCKKMNRWPSYSDQITEIQRPAFLSATNAFSMIEGVV